MIKIIIITALKDFFKTALFVILTPIVLILVVGSIYYIMVALANGIVEGNFLILSESNGFQPKDVLLEKILQITIIVFWLGALIRKSVIKVKKEKSEKLSLN